MQYKIRATIRYKASVLEPQGQAIEKILSSEFKSVISSVRVGREVEFFTEAGSESEAKDKAASFADYVLYNPVMETIELEVV